jgi:hypothetical protein
LEEKEETSTSCCWASRSNNRFLSELEVSSCLCSQIAINDKSGPVNLLTDAGELNRKPPHSILPLVPALLRDISAQPYRKRLRVERNSTLLGLLCNFYGNSERVGLTVDCVLKLTSTKRFYLCETFYSLSFLL